MSPELKTPCIQLQISYLSHKQLKLNSRFFYQNHFLLPQPSISGQQKASPPNNHCLHVSHTFPSHRGAPSFLSTPLPSIHAASPHTPAVSHCDNRSSLLTCPLASKSRIPQVSSLHGASGVTTEKCHSDTALAFA